MSTTHSSAATTILRLHQCMNTHDLEGLLDCFHPSYESIQPSHPERSFKGLAALRASWAAVFATLPDFQAALGRYSATGDTVWTEWCWHGALASGEPYDSVGVIVFDLLDDRIVCAHVYSDALPAEEMDWDGLLANLIRDQPEELED